ncbi:hypothetical protein [Actinoplanes sp. NPDC051859]|uniref:hypothetical protein n=1 Tax=Actinoplanes sp. NPDC051859 TaxID=3363909 RepID=UPI00379201AA
MTPRPGRTRTSRLLRSPLPYIGTATALVIGTGVAAYGDWDVNADRATFTVHAASIPRMDAPNAVLPSGPALVDAGGRILRGPRITWSRVEITPSVGVQRYVVTRNLGPIRQIACDVPAPRRGCVDLLPPAGYLVTYTVVATHGRFWTGTPSQASQQLLLPGKAEPIVVDGVVVTPGPGGTAVVPGVDPSTSAVAPAPGTVSPPAGPSPDVPVPSSAPVIVPPEPPESAPVEESVPPPVGSSGPAPTEENEKETLSPAVE